MGKKTGLEHCAVASFKYPRSTAHNIAKCFSVLPKDAHVTAARDNTVNKAIEFLIHSAEFPENVINAKKPKFPMIAFCFEGGELTGFTILPNGTHLAN